MPFAYLRVFDREDRGASGHDGKEAFVVYPPVYQGVHDAHGRQQADDDSPADLHGGFRGLQAGNILAAVFLLAFCKDLFLIHWATSFRVAKYTWHDCIISLPSLLVNIFRDKLF